MPPLHIRFKNLFNQYYREEGCTYQMSFICACQEVGIESDSQQAKHFEQEYCTGEQ